MKTFDYPSKSSNTVHTVSWDDEGDGLISCSGKCRGYWIKRGDKPRSCTHTEDVVKRLGLHTVQRDDLIYAIAGEAGTGVNPERLEQRTAASIESALAQAEADGYVNPMLAQALTKGQEKNLEQFTSDYIWEEKWDGQRAIVAVKQSQNALAWSRPRPGEGTLGKPRTIPKHLLEHAKALPDGTYDTEELVPGARSWAVSDLKLRDQKVYIFFDLPIIQGQQIMDKPIEIRRRMLAEILRLANSPYLRLSETFAPGRAGVEEIWARGGEGAMLKRHGSLYLPGYRAKDWLKVKLWDYTTVTLTKFIKAKEGDYAVMGFMMDSGVESRCKTLGNKWLREFAQNGAKYLNQRFVMKHQGLTDDGKPRHPQFDHFAGEGE
jgi:hypothetical protein